MNPDRSPDPVETGRIVVRSHVRSNDFKSPDKVQPWMIKRTEITIETRRVLVVRRRQFLRGWCQACLAEVQMITPNEAATLASVSARTIYRWIEEARLHFSEEERDGTLLVCADSVRAPRSGAKREEVI
jgi:hypothetical protein